MSNPIKSVKMQFLLRHVYKKMGDNLFTEFRPTLTLGYFLGKLKFT